MLLMFLSYVGTGAIPPEMGALTSLMELDLSDNQLSGELTGVEVVEGGSYKQTMRGTHVL